MNKKVKGALFGFIGIGLFLLSFWFMIYGYSIDDPAYDERIRGKVVDVNNETFIINEKLCYGGHCNSTKEYVVKHDGVHPELGSEDEFIVHRYIGGSTLHYYELEINYPPYLPTLYLMVALGGMILSVLCMITVDSIFYVGIYKGGNRK